MSLPGTALRNGDVFPCSRACTVAVMQHVAPLTPHQLRCVAAIAEADPRTVQRVATGLPVRPSAAARIVQALAQLGLVSRAADALHTREPEAVR